MVSAISLGNVKSSLIPGTVAAAPGLTFWQLQDVSPESTQQTNNGHTNRLIDIV